MRNRSDASNTESVVRLWLVRFSKLTSSMTINYTPTAVELNIITILFIRYISTKY